MTFLSIKSGFNVLFFDIYHVLVWQNITMCYIFAAVNVITKSRKQDYKLQRYRMSVMFNSARSIHTMRPPISFELGGRNCIVITFKKVSPIWRDLAKHKANAVAI